MVHTGKMSASSSKKMIKMPIDRLSALPDDILCYILSFLEMKEASITCLLSKRWQFLWTQLPGLRFIDGWVHGMEKAHKFVNRVNRTLAICSGHNLELFEVYIVSIVRDYKEWFAYSYNVNDWIGFAVKNKVKEFILQLPEESAHILPQMMFSNLYWTSLTLGRCIMVPQGTIVWPSLTTLCLEFVELNEHTFEKIFSGCPVLSSLDLMFCWGFHLLEVNSPSLHRLAIKHEEDCGNLKISAPYIRTMIIQLEIEYRKMCFGNFKSLVRAEINIIEWDWDDPIHWKECIEQLFGSIQHAKMLKLVGASIELLSKIAPNLQLPQLRRACLELHVDCCYESIPGIALLLKSSPNLETLVIHNGCGYYPDAIELNPASKNDLDCDLFHLKTVCF